MPPLQIVWFKRDLRIVDHRPLLAAAERGPVLPLYIVEPKLWQQPDASERQWLFCREALLELRRSLADLGQPLVVRTGDVVQVLERARRQFGIDGLWSHEETGNGWTYQRDKRVGLWVRQNGIEWIEIPQFGVTRRMRTRNGWAKRWEAQMTEPLTSPPAGLPVLEGMDPGVIPERPCPELPLDHCPQRQTGVGARSAWGSCAIFCNTVHRAINGPCRARIRRSPAVHVCRPISPGDACRCGRSCRPAATTVVAVSAALNRGSTGTAISFRSWRISRRLNSATSTLLCVAFAMPTAID